MLKTGLKNFFKNFLYVFVPMGIIYLFAILVTYGFLFNCIKELGVMLNDTVRLVEQSVESSGTEIQDFLAYAEGQIDWNAGLYSIVKQIIDTNWITSTVTGFLATLDISVVGFSDSLTVIIKTFSDSVITSLIVGLVIFFIGVVLANFLTGCVLRRKTAKRTAKQFIVNWLLNPVFNALLGAALLWIATIIKGFALLLVVTVALVYVIMSLTFAWFVYKDKSLRWRNVVNLKNVALCIATAIIIVVIDIAIFLLAALFSVAIAILLLVPLLIYSLKIIDFNAASYILSVVKNQAIMSQAQNEIS